jgi:hypothetical protein
MSLRPPSASVMLHSQFEDSRTGLTRTPRSEHQAGIETYWQRVFSKLKLGQRPTDHTVPTLTAGLREASLGLLQHLCATPSSASLVNFGVCSKLTSQSNIAPSHDLYSAQLVWLSVLRRCCMGSCSWRTAGVPGRYRPPSVPCDHDGCLAAHTQQREMA